MAMERVVKVKDSLAYTVWSGIVGLIVFILVMIAAAAKGILDVLLLLIEMIAETLVWTVERNKK